MFAEDYRKINPSKEFLGVYLVLCNHKGINAFLLVTMRNIFFISRLLYYDDERYYNIVNALCTNFAMQGTETFHLGKLCAMKDELICMLGVMSLNPIKIQICSSLAFC